MPGAGSLDLEGEGGCEERGNCYNRTGPAIATARSDLQADFPHVVFAASRTGA